MGVPKAKDRSSGTQCHIMFERCVLLLSSKRVLVGCLLGLAILISGCTVFRKLPGFATVPKEIVSPPPGFERLEQVVEQSSHLMAEAEKWYEKGVVAYEQGDVETARKFFQQSLEYLAKAEPDAETLYRLKHLYERIPLQGPAIPSPEAQPEPVAEPLPTEKPKGVEERREEPGKTGTFRVVVNEYVQREMDAYCGDMRDRFAEGLTRAATHLPVIRQIIEHEGLPAELAYLPLVESNFLVRAHSRAGASGLWQFMSSTAERYGLVIDRYVDERYDIKKSTYAAVKHLSNLYDLFGSWELALAAYNAGETTVWRAMLSSYNSDFWKLICTKPGCRILREETKAYVPKVMAAIIIAHNLEKYGFSVGVEDDPPNAETLLIKGSVDLHLIARECGVSLTTIRELNPELRMNQTPFRESGYELNVPVGTREKLEVALAKMPVTKGVESFRHVVRRGETLSAIAKRYATSVESIREANGLSYNAVLQVGQYLVIGASAPASPPRTRPPAEKTGEELMYTVKDGDTLWGISRAFNVSVADLKRWNIGRFGEAKELSPGDKLLIKVAVSNQGDPKAKEPREIRYVVKKGDSLWDVANRYKVSVRAIVERNRLRSTRLDPGDELIIPAG